MPVFDVKFVAKHSSSKNIKINQAALHENGHSSVVRYATFEMLRLEMNLFNVKFVAVDSSLTSIKSLNLLYMKMATVQLLARSHLKC